MVNEMKRIKRVKRTNWRKVTAAFGASLGIAFGLSLGATAEEPPGFFEEDGGNLKPEYVEAMQAEWCAHNRGKEFARERCAERTNENINEEELNDD